jgi:hypothetical protein
MISNKGSRTAVWLLIAAPLLAGPTQAIAARPDTRAMTCDYAQAFIKQHRSVVMTTGPYTYARLVSGLGYCGPGEDVRLITAPTLDNPRCRVGYICQPNPFH